MARERSKVGFKQILSSLTHSCKYLNVAYFTAPGQSKASKELQNLAHLDTCCRGSLSSRCLVRLFESFTHEGLNDVHQCFVFELLGPTVDKILTDYHLGQDKLNPESILRTTTQLLEALTLTHSVGMYHGDNINPSVMRYELYSPCARNSGRNIAFSCTNLLEATEEQLFAIVDRIDEDDKITGSWIWRELSPGRGTRKYVQLGTLRVLETISQTTLIITLIDGAIMNVYPFLFTAYPFWYFDEDMALISQMIELVERIPTAWEPKCKETQIET
ncbi:hypothetical protein N7448_006809 [Penicillium atrosanguineum]|uniref:Protein kinase domain-containing protein n=1 Tax=Penicillium atrosanguineum TaxID=1132637 RepID=A0A9W9L2U1_9EURO|nr:hypothetical protein N7448_006809 [Penicillium atrosanguineum]KAJ5308140.1 hypothetical protein N7476_008796 [Penicillium atrosanguineum]